MIRKLYKDIRPILQTGDLVAFGGHTAISTVIKTMTASNVSHVGIILEVNTSQASLPLVMLVESTSLGSDFAGVRISRMSTRVKAYSGDLWILPIAGAINIHGVEAYLLSVLGVAYDYKQAIGSAFDFSFHGDQKEDLSKLFCSELCTEVYSRNIVDSDVVPTNSSEQTPIDVCRFPIYSKVYQILGKSKNLS